MKQKSKLLPLLLSIIIALTFSFGGFTTASAGNPVIKAGKTTFLKDSREYRLDYSTATKPTVKTYLKIKPKYSGNIMFITNFKSKVRLLNAKKKPRSTWRALGTNYAIDYLNDVNFGVKGGQVYYLYLSGKKPEGEYTKMDTIRYTNTKSCGAFGKTAKTAKKIKRKMHYHTGFLQSSSRAKYYTFNKKSSKVEFFIVHTTDYCLKATITITAPGMKKYRKVVPMNRMNQYGNSEGKYFCYRVPKHKNKNMKIVIKMDHYKYSSGSYGICYL